MSTESEPSKASADATLSKRHLRFGWYCLLAFLSLGAVLEALHGFKVGYYVDANNETRRLMLRLGHAHGTLLGLVNLAFAVSLRAMDSRNEQRLRLASACLIVSALVLPAGFFLGGLTAYDGDPGLLVLLVPVGAVLLFVGILSAARSVG